MDILTVILEILKYTIPALVVYLLMRQFIRGQLIVEQAKVRAAQTSEHNGLRIQAYERLTLLCERIDLNQLLIRLNSDNLSAEDLKNGLLITVQKEFEHNLTQQIYVSSTLWEMMLLLKSNIIATVTQGFANSGGTDKAKFEEILIQQGQIISSSLAAKVKAGIRKEVELFFK